MSSRTSSLRAAFCIVLVGTVLAGACFGGSDAPEPTATEADTVEAIPSTVAAAPDAAGAAPAPRSGPLREPSPAYDPLPAVTTTSVGVPTSTAGGPLIAFETNRDGNSEIYLMHADGSEQRNLTNNSDAEDWGPVWSPDGSRIAFKSRTEAGNFRVQVTDVDGAGLITVVEFENIEMDGGLAWSPDGTRLACALAPLVSFDGDFDEGTDESEGNAGTSAEDAGSTPNIHIFEVGDSEARLIASIEQAGTPAWSPDGGRIAFLKDADIHVMNADGTDVTNITNSPVGEFGIAWLPDSERILSSCGVFACIINADGSGSVTVDEAGTFDSTLSPDGTRVAFTAVFVGSGDIHIVNVDGTGLTNLTNDPAPDSAPIWSPDGTRISFFRDTQEKDTLYVVNADGGDLTELAESRLGFYRAWSPDGSTILFVREEYLDARIGNIYAINPDGTGERPLTTESGVWPVWSPLPAMPTPDEEFQRVWSRADLPVQAGMISRTWVWGPQPNTTVLTEPYTESPGGERSVQYFDKARMELNQPGGTAGDVWSVTTGLLVVEMITGQMQIGDASFEQRAPAEINVAGDTGDPAGSTGMTYATLGALLDAPPLPVGTLVTQRVDRSATVMDDPTLAAHGITVALVDEVTNHAIADPFWEFMTSQGMIYESGDLLTGPLFENPYYATGRPVAEPYWASVKVAGVYQDVLIQCFERRCLTYTPNNLEGWRVEAGNVGLHYYAWRYGSSGQEGRIAFTTFRDGNSQVHTINVEGTGRTKLTGLPDGANEPTWSPDGSRILFLSYEFTNSDVPHADIYVMNSDGSNVLNLTQHPDEDSTPVWSPDGTRVAFTRGYGEIMVVNADGSGLMKLTDGEEPSWSPGGERIAFRRGDGIHLINVDGSGLTNLTNIEAFYTDPVWSPDGGRIAFISDQSDNFDIWVVNVDGSGLTNLTNHPADDVGPISWSPDGTKIAYISQRENALGIYAMNPDGSDARLIAEGEGLAWSPDGARIAFARYAESGGDVGIYLADAGGSGLVYLTEGGNPAWSPDGSRIVFSATGGKDSEIYVMVGNGDVETNLTNHAAADWEPTWSPDGAKLAFMSNRDGRPGIYLMNPDGSSPVKFSPGNDDAYDPEWSPDGAWIAYIKFTGEHHNIFVTRIDGSATTQLTFEGGEGPVWSPDGTHIAYSWLGEVYVMAADGSDRVNLSNRPEEDSWPTWSPDGTRLAFTTFNEPDSSSLWLVNVDGSGLTRLEAASEWYSFPAWSPDGAFIAYSTTHRLETGASTTELRLIELSTGQDRPLAGIGAGWPLEWSPDGREILFNRDQNIFAVDILNGQITQLTTEGGSEPDWSP